VAWNEITRREYRRDDLAYASDLRDWEWVLLVPRAVQKSGLALPEERKCGLKDDTFCF